MEKQAFLSLDPATLSPALRALWYDARDDWQAAHEEAQAEVEVAGGAGSSRDNAWVHAYLHRKEGDQWNAEYWYRRAGKPVYRGSLPEEWASMVQALLAPQGAERA